MNEKKKAKHEKKKKLRKSNERSIREKALKQLKV